MDESEPISERQRFLLPDGCKDLYDVIKKRSTPLNFSVPDHLSAQSKTFIGIPKKVALPDPVTVRQLAEAIHIKPFYLIGALLTFNVFASVNTSLALSSAKRLCALYGVEATRAD
jgi:hypothetical protein